MPWIDPKSLTLELQGRTCLVCAPFWSVTHDLDRGGTPVELRFAHGPAGNVLREPLAARVDRWSETDGSARLISARKNADGIELIFRSASKVPGLAFQTTYHYTPYQLRRELRLSFPRGFQA
jgi:hypothetical protein